MLGLPVALLSILFCSVAYGGMLADRIPFAWVSVISLALNWIVLWRLTKRGWVFLLGITGMIVVAGVAFSMIDEELSRRRCEAQGGTWIGEVYYNPEVRPCATGG